MLAVTLMVVIACVLTIVAYEITQRRKSRGVPTGGVKAALGVLLTFALVATSFTGYSGLASADTGSGGNVGGLPPSGGSGGSSTPAGFIQTSDHINMLRVGFVITSGGKVVSKKRTPLEKGAYDPGNGSFFLDEISKATDLDSEMKFSDANAKTMFYMAPNSSIDSIARSSNSGLAYYDPGSKSVKISSGYGRNNLFGGGSGDNDAWQRRMLLYADMNYADNNSTDNYFRKMMASSLYNIAPSNANRNLAEGSNGATVGQNLRSFINTTKISESRKSDLPKEYQTDAAVSKGQAAAHLVVEDYLKLVRAKGLLGSNGSVYDQYEKQIWDAFEAGNLSLVAESVVGFYVKGSGNGSTGPFTFLPFHDAVHWYTDVRKDVRPNDTKVQSIKYTREAEAVTNGGASAASSTASADVASGNMSYSFREYAKSAYSRTLKPISDTVKLTTDITVNPFGGWGYQPFGYGNGTPTANDPGITAFMDVTVKDASGQTTKHFVTPVDGWAKDDARKLADLTDENFSVAPITGDMSVSYEGELFKLKSGKAPVTIIDVTDTENINKDPLKVSTPGDNIQVDVPLEGSDQWNISFGFAIPDAVKLNQYLGGTKVSSEVDNKYAKKTNPAFSDAKVVIYLQAEALQADPVETSFIVPQWRLSKYWGSIAGTPEKVQDSTFSLTVPRQTGKNAKLRPSGSVNFKLIDPDLSSITWAFSKAVAVPNSIDSITVNKLLAKVSETGTLLAVKSNQEVMNTKFASWVNQLNLLDRVGSATKGVPENKPKVVKNFPFKYAIKNPNSSYKYSETRYKKNSKGKKVSYTYTGSATPHYTDVTYDTTVTFNRLIPKANVTPKKFSDNEQAANGKYWESVQSDKTLKVNPEVPMAYSDQNGNTSVAFTAGDVMRTIQPVAYNMGRYINVGVDPKVNGASVATDTNAKKLASSLTAGGKEVIYKGSAITTNFAVNGQLELKTFALDIGSTSLKNEWNPGTSYSTDKINEDFLSQYAKKTNGKWQVEYNATGNLKINGKDEGGKEKKLVGKQVKEGMIEHKLIVRGGKLFSVDGITNFESLDPTLKEALERAHLLDNDNIFNNFQRQGGAVLDEAGFATLANALRGGTTDIQSGKGWYQEDTTVLVFREYTNTFELPQFMYVDKVPMQIAGLEAPINKLQFFSKGYRGYTKMLLEDTEKLYMQFDSSAENGNLKGFFRSDGSADPNKSTIDYIVPNVSVTDTFSSQ